jgi:GNAT superfamily N-acetyltransferase
MSAQISPAAATLLPHCGELIRQPLAVRTWVRRSCLRMIQAGTVPTRPMPTDDSGIAWIKTAAGDLAGFATYYETTANSLWLDLLWIEDAWRRRGMATALLNMVTAMAIAKRLDSVELGHVTYNAPMVALMKKHGWAVDHIVRAKRLR